MFLDELERVKRASFPSARILNELADAPDVARRRLELFGAQWRQSDRRIDWTVMTEWGFRELFTLTDDALEQIVDEGERLDFLQGLRSEFDFLEASGFTTIASRGG